MSRLGETHRVRQLALREELARRLGVLLGRVVDTSDTDVAGYIAAAHPLVEGGQRAAASFSAAYGEAGARRASRSSRRRPLDVAGALGRSGVLVTPSSPSIAAPVLRAMHLSATGTPLVAAVAQAASYAYGLSSNDLQAASSVGMQEGVEASGSRILGYSKDTAPGCCEWCGSWEGEVFDTADAVPFHARDTCSVAPVYQ